MFMTSNLTYLSKCLGFGVFLEAECREVNACSEHLCLGQDTDSSNSVYLHFHVRVAVRVS